jgi:hypothetical protein
MLSAPFSVARKSSSLLFLVLLLAAATAKSDPAPEPTGDNPPVTAPPDHPTDEAYSSFYTKHLDAGGIVIRANHDVSDVALGEARRRIDLMLGHLPTVRANLCAAGAEVHIIGKDEVTSDLPENRYMKGKPFQGDLTVDQRTRGLGGLLTSCGEENLLRLPEDRYFGRDILVHEFGHNILNNGANAAFRQQVEQRYHASLAAGKWVKAYAATNSNEFFAELSMWYFGTHGDLGMEGEKPVAGREGLRKYDPGAFALLDDFYQGRIETPAGAALAALPAAREAFLRSHDSDTPSTIIFHNNTGQMLQLYWIDYQGRRKPYGWVPPHAVDERSTFATHPWLCVDKSGHVVALFVALPGDCIATIKEAGT